MFTTPILLLIFNRPDTTEKVFEKLRILKPKYLYVGADGPRANKPDDVLNCAKTRNILSRVDWDCEVKTLFRNTNLGCGVAPAKAITWFFEHVEQGIILEDDILTDESFFPFCEFMLERYKNEQRVMHISGCYFLESFSPPSRESYYFTKHIHVWGWATWRRAWKYYDYDMKDYPSLRSNKKLKSYYGEYFIFWKDIFQRLSNKGNDIWDYQWMFAIYKHNGIAINPSVNLTQNIGFNNNATHTTNSNSVYTSVKLASLTQIKPPADDNNINTEKDNLYYKFFLEFDLQAELQKRNTLWKLKKLLKKLKAGSQEISKLIKSFLLPKKANF